MRPDFESRKLEDLEPLFGAKVQILLENCAARGYTLKPFYTVRGPAVQGKIYAQSRTQKALNVTKENLAKQGAPWLASMIPASRPGAWLSGAAPGFSWHQWGEAVDCFVEVDKKAVWDGNHEGYRVYAEEATKLGLTAGYSWKKVDSVHVQKRSLWSPTGAFNVPQIEQEMKKRFAD